MTSIESSFPLNERRAEALFKQHQLMIFRQTDLLFAWILFIEWFAGIACAYWISPRTWTGTMSQAHLHLWTAIFLGGAITLFPAFLAITRAGLASTRNIIAVAQVLVSALYIHLTGGRIETHFHVFGSLAILAFYRDWKILIPATLVVAFDHWIRGLYWPQSVYGILVPEPWRWLEHAGWVVFEDIFLIISCLRSKKEMRQIAEHTARLEESYQAVEVKVVERTAELEVSRLEALKMMKDAEESRRKAVEAKEILKESEERLNLALKSSEVGAWSWDITHNKVVWDDFTYSLFGMKSGGFDGKYENFLATIHPDDRERVRNEVKCCLDGGAPYDTEFQVVWPDGAIHAIVSRGKVYRDEKNWPIRMAGVCWDITSHKAMRAQLVQAQKMETIGTLAGGLAHDLNNQLTPLLGYVDLLLKSEKLDAKSRELLLESLQAAKRCAEVVQRLVHFSRPSTQKKTHFALKELLKEYKGLLKTALPANISVEIHTEENLGLVYGNETEIQTVFMNFATNARDAMTEKGGRFVVEAKSVDLDEKKVKAAFPPGRYVAISFHDTGCGMPSPMLHRIFEPFFTTKKKDKGTGLGLSMVFNIIKDHGGWVNVESAVNRGTTFRVYLPLAEKEREKERVHANGSVLPQGSGTVLFADDEESLRKLGKVFLERLGYTVLMAADGEEAVKIYDKKHQEIEAVVLDMTMPKLTGKETLKKLLQINPKVKVILASGYTSEGSARDLLQEGASYFITKPYTIAPLAQALQKVLK